MQVKDIVKRYEPLIIIGIISACAMIWSATLAVSLEDKPKVIPASDTVYIVVDKTINVGMRYNTSGNTVSRVTAGELLDQLQEAQGD